MEFVRTGIAFKTIENENDPVSVQQFSLHLEAAINAMNRHLGRKLHPDSEYLWVADVPRSCITIQADKNKVKMFLLSAIKDNKCYVKNPKDDVFQVNVVKTEEKIIGELVAED